MVILRDMKFYLSPSNQGEVSHANYRLPLRALRMGKRGLRARKRFGLETLE